MKNIKPILVVGAEPNSIFLEILFKTLLKEKFKSPIILIVSLKVFKLQLKKLNYKILYNIVDFKMILKNDFDKHKINLINIDYDNSNKAFQKISTKSNKYIERSFNLALKIINYKITDKLISGPISKKNFLKKKYLGITEYLANKSKSKNFAMLIYNKNLSVSPLTTHLPIKFVRKAINKKIIINKIKLLNNFYIKKLQYKPKIALTGLNPHCESIDKFNEDEKIIKPCIKILKKNKINILGPFPADTLFLKNNRKKFDLVIGIYHDQVLTPMKTLFEYDAINITLGLSFIRVSPDHGPNEKMIGKNKSNPKSLIQAFKFLDNLIN